MLRFKKALSALLILGMVFSLSACNSNLALFINVKAGDNYKYHMLMNQTTNTETMGQKSSSTQEMTTDYTISVADVDSEGNMTLNYKYDTIKVEMETNGTKQTIDSNSSDSDDPTSGMYKKLIGKGFSTKMTKYGEIKEVSGIDDMINSMVESINSGDSEEMASFIEQTKASLKESFGDETIKSNIQQSTNIFPKTSIKIGDSWDVNSSIQTLVPLDIKTTYTLDKVENGIAYISLKAEYHTDNSEASDFMGMKMTTDISGTMTGTIKANIKNGLLSEGEITQNMTGKMSIIVPGTDVVAEQTIDMPMDSNSTITYTTTKM
ncbi:MAG: hypothetical protein BWY74_00877 [Firmicutes bacterium ADurb.Bin419]|nr:MAG: hypothetical protein BWY74_00877 [Firmicutes bacterium ADurb.Bin419]